MRADLTEQDLRFADLSQADLTGAVLERAPISRAQISADGRREPFGRRISEGLICGATDGMGSCFAVELTLEAQASSIRHSRCDLSAACLERANLRNTNFRGAACEYQGARFAGMPDMGVAIQHETDLEDVDLPAWISTTLACNCKPVASSSNQTEKSSPQAAAAQGSGK